MRSLLSFIFILCIYVCVCVSLPRCEMTESCQLSRRRAERGSLCDPNRGPDITVSLPGGKPNAGPISNLVFHKIWQLVCDDKLTEIFPPPGNLWQRSSTHTHAEQVFIRSKVASAAQIVSLQVERKQKMTLSAFLFGCRDKSRGK